MSENILNMNEATIPNDSVSSFKSELKKEKQSPKKSNGNIKSEEYKTKECKVIAYNKRTNTLDVMFDRYGIRIKNVKNFSGCSSIEVKYCGEIGKANFKYKL